MILSPYKILNFIHCLVGVVFLISGNLFIYEADMYKSAIQIFTSIYILIFLLKESNIINLTMYHLVYFALGSVVFLFCMMNSEIIDYALMKFDAVIFNALISAIYFNILINKITFNDFLKNIIFVGLFLLVPTLVYKYIFGFFQRDIRFLLNGANVFGWLSGFYALLCLIFLRNKVYFLFFLVFLFCVFWSQSKGALISLFISSLLLVLYRNKFSLKAIGKVIMMIPIFFAFKFIASNYFSDSRINAIFRIIEGNTGDSDYGSVGIRFEMYNSALELFYSNMLTGIGLGDFSIYTNYDIMYPHNVPLELLAEMGFIGISFFIIFYLLFYTINKNLYLTIFVIYFFIVCLFSGDISYLRYSMVFVLLGLFIQPKYINE